MAQEQRRLSRRDEVYLSSPGFEPYLAAGTVFIVIFTAIFIYSIKGGDALLVWPGLFVAVLGGYLTLNRLQKREYARKLAEVESDPVADEITRQ